MTFLSCSTMCLLSRFTDESKAYNRVKNSGRNYSTVCHSIGEFARDDNKDGINEVHCNSCEGLWIEVRNFLHPLPWWPFKGIHKKYLAQYIAMFENAFNFKEQPKHVVRAMMVSDYFLENHTSP